MIPEMEKPYSLELTDSDPACQGLLGLFDSVKLRMLLMALLLRMKERRILLVDEKN